MNLMSEFKQAIADRDKRIAELEEISGKWEDRYFTALDNVTQLGAENERLRCPACGTEQVWLDTIRHDDDQALLWFRAMQRESEDKKKAMEDAERLRKALDECADDLKGYVEHQYAFMHDDPDMNRRYERDIEPVRKARKLLAAMEVE